MSFLKMYQQKQVYSLKQSSSMDDVVCVCKQIVADDTGHTDELTQELAKAVIKKHEHPFGFFKRFSAFN